MLNKKINKFVYDKLTVVREEGAEYACYCPFHHNVDSPAFYVNKTTGLFYCHNPSCGVKGRFATLVKKLTGDDFFQTPQISDEEIDEIFKEETKLDEGFDAAMERITLDYRNSEDIAKLQYLVDRGFEPSVLEHFEVGYSAAQDRIVIPARDENFKIVGFIGRSLDNERVPKYKYSTGFPRKSILLNLCHAKNYSEVIVVEGSLDHIKVHQAGFPNVVSTMGSNVADEHIALINRYFSTVIIFADDDEAGHKMRDRLANSLAKSDLFVVQYKSSEGKDPGELTSEQIREYIQNKISIIDYQFNQMEEKSNGSI